MRICAGHPAEYLAAKHDHVTDTEYADLSHVWLSHDAPACVHMQNVGTIMCTWQRKVDLTVKSAGSPERWIYGLRPATDNTQPARQLHLHYLYHSEASAEAAVLCCVAHVLKPLPALLASQPMQQMLWQCTTGGARSSSGFWFYWGCTHLPVCVSTISVTMGRAGLKWTLDLGSSTFRMVGLHACTLHAPATVSKADVPVQDMGQRQYLLVAAMTMTEPRSCSPSSRESRVATTEANTWSCPPARCALAGTSPSSSSRNTMAGALFVACTRLHVLLGRGKQKSWSRKQYRQHEAC